MIACVGIGRVENGGRPMQKRFRTSFSFGTFVSVYRCKLNSLRRSTVGALQILLSKIEFLNPLLSKAGHANKTPNRMNVVKNTEANTGACDSSGVILVASLRNRLEPSVVEIPDGTTLGASLGINEGMSLGTMEGASLGT